MSIAHQSATFTAAPTTRPIWGRLAVMILGTAVGIGLMAAAVLGAVLVLMSSLAS